MEENDPKMEGNDQKWRKMIQIDPKMVGKMEESDEKWRKMIQND